MPERRGAAPAVKLPQTLAIGFSGHRKLSDEAKSREAIRKVLRDWKTKVPGVLYGVSSTASGGDLLFAETCLELDLPIRVFLPFAKEKFREDFDEESWKRAERVMTNAISVEVTGAGEDATERYYECGIETVQQSQLLVAVWDGEPARGLGGTEDIVNFAKQQERPIVWIHSETGEVRQLNPNPELLRDPEMDFLNELQDATGGAPTGTPLGLAQSWFNKVDENASHVAPQFRRLAAIPIFCTAAAALLSSRASGASGKSIWLVMGTVLGVMAGALPVAMRLDRRQILWTRMRTAAEICRSYLALWRTPTLYDVIGPETVPELAGMLGSLHFLKMMDRAWHHTTLEEFKGLYRAERVQNQIGYFSRHAEHSAAEVRKYKIVTAIAVTIAAGLNVWILLSGRVPDVFVVGHWKTALALAATTGFQVATVAAALLVVHDHERRRQRYRELHRMLKQWDKQLEIARTWPIVLRITSMVEKALLAELIEWRSLIKNRKVPQK